MATITTINMIPDLVLTPELSLYEQIAQIEGVTPYLADIVTIWDDAEGLGGVRFLSCGERVRSACA
jgi:hypothetical protein